MDDSIYDHMDEGQVEDYVAQLVKSQKELREVVQVQSMALQALRDLSHEYTTRQPKTNHMLGFEGYRDEVNRIVDFSAPKDLQPQQRAGLPNSALSDYRRGELTPLREALADVNDWTPEQLWPLVDRLVLKVGLRRLDLPKDDLLGHVHALREQAGIHGRAFGLADSLALQGWTLLSAISAHELREMLLYVTDEQLEEDAWSLASHIVIDLGIVPKNSTPDWRTSEIVKSLTEILERRGTVNGLPRALVDEWHIDPKTWTDEHRRIRAAIRLIPGWQREVGPEVIEKRLLAAGLIQTSTDRTPLGKIVNQKDRHTLLPKTLVEHGWVLKPTMGE